MTRKVFAAPAAGQTREPAWKSNARHCKVVLRWYTGQVASAIKSGGGFSSHETCLGIGNDSCSRAAGSPVGGPGSTRVELQSIEHGAAGSDGEPGASRSGPGGRRPTETSMPGELGADPLRPYTGGTMAATSSSRSSSGSQTRRTSQPMSVQTRTTPHTFYPGMRAAQGPNRNVAPQCTHSRAAFLAPGMMSPGAGMMGSTSAKSRSQR